MSLLHPTRGEMIDRWILLYIKIRVGGARGLNVDHHEVESSELAAAMGPEGQPYQQTWHNLFMLHMEMFELIDKAERGIEVSSVYLQKLNRERVRLREDIDKEMGEFRGPERI